MMRVLATGALGLGLAGCQTTQTATTAPAPAVAPIDQKIAVYSTQLAQECAVAKGGLLIAKVYVAKPKVLLALDVASLTVNRFCASPPQNVQDAIAQVAQAAADLAVALKDAQS